MSYRLSQIYTRTGDDGKTTLGKRRLPKNHPLLETLGTLDELNSALGLALAFEQGNAKLRAQFCQIQQELFDLGGELAEPSYEALTTAEITRLEHELDEWNKTLAPLEEFLMPRGQSAACACHLARTICRRAERCLVSLHEVEPLRKQEPLIYLNRLSDYLFVAARILNLNSETKETLWQPK